MKKVEVEGASADGEDDVISRGANASAACGEDDVIVGVFVVVGGDAEAVALIDVDEATAACGEDDVVSRDANAGVSASEDVGAEEAVTTMLSLPGGYLGIGMLAACSSTVVAVFVVVGGP